MPQNIHKKFSTHFFFIFPFHSHPTLIIVKYKVLPFFSTAFLFSSSEEESSESYVLTLNYSAMLYIVCTEIGGNLFASSSFLSYPNDARHTPHC
jgi:hypothetical protein